MRVPLATKILTRDGTLTKDGKMVNCYVDPEPDGSPNVVKRPGLAIRNTAALPSLATNQGLVAFGQLMFAVVSDVVYSVFTPAVSGALPAPTLPNLQMNFLSGLVNSFSSNFAVIKSNRDLWQMTTAAPTFAKNVDPDYPATTVPGIAYLDGTFYVLTRAGAINGSAIEDPTTWNALNVILTDRGIGVGVAITRHLNYVLALCDNGLQFFYDAGNPAPGSPLSPVSNASYRVGCTEGFSVASVGDSTLFMSKTSSEGRSVSMLDGLSVVKVSTPAIDRILDLVNLNLANNVHAYGFVWSGHPLYVLSLASSNITLVYDLQVKEWYIWTSGNSGEFPFNGRFWAKANGSQAPFSSDLFLSADDNHVYELDQTQFTDAFGAGSRSIVFQIQTRILDLGTIDPKFMSRINLIGDTPSTVGAGTITVTYSRDDYQTFSSPRVIDLKTERKLLARIGRYRRMSFNFVSSDPNAFRLKQLEIHPGTQPEDT